MPYELALARVPMQAVEQPVDRMVVAERILNHAEMRGGHAVADQTMAIGFGGPDDAAGQRKIEPGPAQHARQEIGAATVGKKPDAHLRHAEAISLSRYAMRTVEANADAAAKSEAVDQRHVRPDEFLEHPDMGVSRAVELTDRTGRALLAPLVQDLEVATAGKHRRVRGLHHHAIDLRVGRPLPILRAQRLEHFPVERV